MVVDQLSHRTNSLHGEQRQVDPIQRTILGDTLSSHLELVDIHCKLHKDLNIIL